jgi:hypothetical protein
MPDPLPVHTKLMAHTAEMLALPHLACRRRDCRRKNACYWHFRASGEPCCLRNLDAEQRRLFDELYEQALLIREHGGHQGLMYAWRDPEQRPLQDTGVDIARATIPARDKRRFDAFRRDRERIGLPGPAASGEPRR